MALPNRHLHFISSPARSQRRWTALACSWAAVAAIGLFVPRVPDAQQLPGGRVVSRAAGGEATRVGIGPGKVRFTQTRNGRWLTLTPVWSEGESVIGGGGFAVYAEAADGSIVELVNTGTESSSLSESAREIPTSREGMAKGSRAPSLDPDDDRDGRIDEDRLDGVDNDRDGLVDEDFAAIGDEMIVTQYDSPSQRIDFHEELYAWSLPHVDEVVMISLRIRSTGDEPLANVRVVVFYERVGDHDLRERVVEAQTTADGTLRRLRSRTLISSNGNGASLALVPFSPATGGDVAWTFGYAEAKEDLSASVARTIAERSERPRSASVPLSDDADVRRAGHGASVYHVSPTFGKLESGEEISVDFALVATPRLAQLDEASTNALATYVGDGVNRYVPPPVALTPRLIWGRYRAAADEDHVVVIDLEDFGVDAVSADDISYFSAIDPLAIEKKTDPSSGATWVLRGDMASGMLSRHDRVTLKGRLDDGEFFELVLRPEGETELDEMFWKTPGKLAQELVSNFPNPFRNATTVFYEIPSEIAQEDGSSLRSTGPYETSVKIYSVSGRLVNTLVENRLFPGLYSADWSAVDERGNAVASGVYYVKLQVEKKYITKRLTLLK